MHINICICIYTYLCAKIFRYNFKLEILDFLFYKDNQLDSIYMVYVLYVYFLLNFSDSKNIRDIQYSFYFSFDS